MMDCKHLGCFVGTRGREVTKNRRFESQHGQKNTCNASRAFNSYFTLTFGALPVTTEIIRQRGCEKPANDAESYPFIAFKASENYYANVQ